MESWRLFRKFNGIFGYKIFWQSHPSNDYARRLMDGHTCPYMDIYVHIQIYMDIKRKKTPNFFGKTDKEGVKTTLSIIKDWELIGALFSHCK